KKVTDLNQVFDAHAAQHIKQAILIQKCLAVMLALLVVLIIMQLRITRYGSKKTRQSQLLHPEHASFINNATVLYRIN
ncbi:hypothetical protein, partial [Enterococcus faecium]